MFYRCRFIILIFIAATFLGRCADLSADSRSAGFVLKERFRQAEIGDFFVAYLSKTYTLLHIYDKSDRSLVLEEISVPSRYAPKDDWKSWVRDGAPRHSSWVIYEIDLESGNMIEFYSFTQGGWADVHNADSFLSTLLHIQLYPIAIQDRKHVGQQPTAGDLDRRRLWQPPCVVDGLRRPDINFDAWRCRWPNDGGDLAGKSIDIYLPQEDPSFPSYFPYWIEVRGAIGKAKLRIQDSGRLLVSPKTGLPRRPPTFLDQGHYKHQQLTFRVSSPPYYQEFLLFATPTEQPWRESIALSHQVEKNSKDHTLKLIVNRNTLREKLTSGTQYHFSIVPKDEPRLSDQTQCPLLWKDEG